MSIGTAQVVIEADASGFGDTASKEVSDALDSVLASAASVMNGLEAETSGVFDGLAASAEGAADGVEGSLGDAMREVERTAGTSAASAAGSVSSISDGAAESGSKISSAMSSAMDEVAADAARAGSSVSGEFADGAAAADSALNGIDGDGFAAASGAASRAASDVAGRFAEEAGRADAALAGVDGDGFNSATSSGSRSATSIREAMQRAAEEVGSSWRDTGQEIEESLAGAEGAARSFGDIAKTAAGGAAALFGLAGAGQLVGDAFAKNTSIEDTTAVLGVLTGSAEEAGSVMDELVESNMATPISFDLWAEAGKTLVAFGMDTADVSDTVTALGEASAASGSGAEGLQRLSRAFGQAMATGTMQGDTLNQLMESGVPALDILGNHYGKTAEEMKKMASEGLPAEEAIAVLTEGIMEGTDGVSGSTAAFAGTMEELSLTTSGVLGNLRSAFVNVISAAIEPFLGSIKGIATWMNTAAYQVRDFINWLQNGSVAADIFKVALGAIAGLTVVSIIANLASGVSLLAKVTAGATKVWKFLNLAFLTSPVGMVITGIVAVVAVFSLLWKHVEGFRNFWIGLWESIKSAMEPVITWITDAFELVKGAWSDLVSAFTSDDAVEGDGALGRLIGVDAANTVLGLLQTVKGAWGELVSAFTSDDAVEGNALGHLIGVDAANMVLGTIQTVKGAWGELTAAFSGGDDGYGALAELIGLDAAEWVMGAITNVQDAWSGLTSLLFEGDYTGAFRNAFGAEEDSAIVGTILTIRNVLMELPDLAQGVADILFRGDFTGLPFGFEEDGVVAGILFGIRDAAIDLWGAFQDLWGILVEVGKTFASAAWTTLQSVLSSLWTVVQSLWNIFTSLAGAVWNLIQALAPVLLPILKVVGAIIGGVVVGAIFALMGALRLVAGLIGVVAKAIGWLVENIVGPLISAIAEVASWLIDKLGGAFAWVADLLGSVFEAIWPTLQAVWEGIQEGWAGFTEWLGEAWAGLQELWETYGQPIVDFVVGAFEGLWEGLQLVFRLVGAAWEVLWTALGKAWEAWGQPALDWVVGAFQWLWGGIEVVFGWVKAGWDLLWQGIQWAWDSLGRPIVDWVVGAFQSLWSGVQVVLGWVRSAWDRLWGFVSGAWESYGQPVIDKVSFAFEWVKLQIDRALWNIRNYIDLAGFKIRSLWAEYVQPMIDWVTDGFADLMETIRGWKDNVIGWFSDAGSWLLQAGKDIVQGIIDGVTSMGGAVWDAFMNMLPDWVKDPFKKALGIESPSRVFMEYGRNIGEGVIEGVRSMEAGVAAATEDMAASAAAAASSASPVVEMGVAASAVPSPGPSVPVGAPGAGSGPGVPGGGFDAAAGTEASEAFAALSASAAELGTSVQDQALGVVAPAWSAMSSEIVQQQEGVIDPSMAALQGRLGAVAGQFQADTATRISPAWAGMAAGVLGQQSGVIDPAMSSVQSRLSAVAGQFQTDTSSRISPAWANMGAGINDVKVKTIDPAFAGLQSGLSAVVGSFANGARDVGTHMQTMRRNTEDPVRFTMNSVFSDGLVEMWNSVSDMIGTDKMVKRYASFATGGIMPGYTPGRDVHRFYSPTGGLLDLSGGEPVLRPEAGKVLGADWVHGINSAARAEGVQGVSRFLEHQHYAAGGIMNFASGGYIPQTPFFGGGVSGIGRSHEAFIERFFPGVFTLTSAIRPGDPGHHGAGRATDWQDSGAQWPTPASKALSRAIAATFPGSLELIHWPTDGWSNIKNGRPATYDAGTNAGHANHVHWATAGPVTADGIAAALTSGGPIDWDIDWGGMLRGMVAETLAAVDATAASANFPGLVGQIPPRTWESMREPSLDSMTASMEEYFKSMGDGGGAERWRPLAMQALARHGYNPAEHIEAMLQQIDIESTGDPTAWNLWDSNYLRGTPSGGLLQVIEPTYQRVRRAYPEAFEGLPDDMMFPLTNLTAGVGAVRMDWGGPAGRWPTRDGYHLGGLMGEGQGWIHKTAEDPEMVLSPVQTAALLDWLDVSPGRQAERVQVMGTSAASSFAGELLSRLGVRSGAEETRISGPGAEDRGRRIVQVTQHFHGGDSREAARSIIDTLDRL